MSAEINKFSKDGHELGASKVGVVFLGKNNFHTREYLRIQFRRILSGDIESMDSTQAPMAAKRGQYLEPGLRNWTSDYLDELCALQGGQLCCNLTIPQEGFRNVKYKMAASLDGILEIKGGVLHYHDAHTGEKFDLEGFGVCEIKTQDQPGPPSYENLIQVQAQMFCSGFKWAIIGKLGPNLKMNWYVYKPEKIIVDKIVESVVDFWNRVDKDMPYDDDYDNETKKNFVDWSGHKRGNEVVDLITQFDDFDNKIKEQKLLKEQTREKIVRTLKSEGENHIMINNKKVSLDTIVRKAQPEKLVPAKPELQYEKFTVKEINNE